MYTDDSAISMPMYRDSPASHVWWPEGNACSCNSPILCNFGRLHQKLIEGPSDMEEIWAKYHAVAAKCHQMGFTWLYMGNTAYTWITVKCMTIIYEMGNTIYNNQREIWIHKTLQMGLFQIWRSLSLAHISLDCNVAHRGIGEHSKSKSIPIYHWWREIKMIYLTYREVWLWTKTVVPLWV